MKETNYLIFLLIVSFICCQEKKKILADNIEKNVLNRTLLNVSKELVLDCKNQLSVLFYTTTLNELKNIQDKFNLSDSIMNQIKTVPYIRSSGAVKVEESNLLNYYTYQETLGSVIKEDNGKINFALIRIKSKSLTNLRIESYTKRVCETILLIFEKCHDEIYYGPKTITEEQKIKITEAIKFSAGNLLLKGVEILRRDDYELYMTDTSSIFSPDHQSVLHMTYFGNIAIGPLSELNAILPIDHEKHNYILEYGYPYRKVYNYYHNKGLFHKFNFLIKNKTEFTNFPAQYDNYIQEGAKKGPYILEIKKNGNVIFYEEKTNNIIWQTNTTNQGKGPYNFYLTNDKILILEDSTGKIIYRSKEYKEMPTIFYGNCGEYCLHFTNGFILSPLSDKYGEKGLDPGFYDSEHLKPFINPKEIHIMTDNDDIYEITYGGKAFNNSFSLFEYDNAGNHDNDFGNIDVKMSKFYANIKSEDDDNYDICYLGYLNGYGWTNITCNGEEIGDKSNIVGKTYIQYLIIYLKEKGEPIPSLKGR